MIPLQARCGPKGG